MADQFIQLQADGTGKKVETSELTRTDGSLVERQRVALGDPNTIGGLAALIGNALTVREQFAAEVLMELRRIARGLELLLDKEIPYED